MKNFIKNILMIFVMALISIMCNNVNSFADTTLNASDYTEIKYVDITGSDTTGDGSSYKPYATIEYCVSNLTTEKPLVYIGKGEYSITSLNVMTKSNSNITFVGKNIDTTIICNNCASLYSNKSTIIGCVIRPSDTLGGDNRFISYTNDSTEMEFRNVAFAKSKNKVYPTECYFQYQSSGAYFTNKYYYNCCFVDQYNSSMYPTNPAYFATNSAYGKYTNCLTSAKNFSCGGDSSDDGSKYVVNSMVNSTFYDTYVSSNYDNSLYGVYSGDYAWDNNNLSVLNVEPNNKEVNLNNEINVDLTIANIKEIAAEDIRIKYDTSKLEFLGFEEVDGIKLINDQVNLGDFRFILASKGLNNVVNSKKTLLKLKFKAINSGDALIDVTKGRVSDGIKSEEDLTDSQCGQTTIKIIDPKDLDKDVNRNGSFTLLDLAIDGRHYGENPDDLPQYITDIVENGAIDDDDLLKIGQYMLENPDYVF